jgi:hypothetical protein
MSTFPTADKLCAWAGVAPGSNQSGGKAKSAKTRKGNAYLRTILVQAARSAVKTDTYNRALYRKLVKNRGDGRAIMAVAHSILKAIHYMLSRQQPYRDLGPDYLTNRRPEDVIKECRRRLASIGYDFNIEPKEIAIAA